MNWMIWHDTIRGGGRPCDGGNSVKSCRLSEFTAWCWRHPQDPSMSTARRSIAINFAVCWAYEELSKIYTSSADGISSWDRIGFGRDTTSRGPGTAQRYDFGLS